MPTAPAPATANTMWRSGSRQESVASRNSSIPPSSTQAIGTRALISQLMRNHGSSGSGGCAAGLALAGSISAVAPLEVLKKLFLAAGAPVVASASGSIGFSGSVPVFLVSGIGVQSRQQVRHSEEGEHHDGESEDCEVSGTASAPAARDPHVQISRIDQPSNRRPRLFGVPIPIGTPGPVGPEGAGGDHQGEQGEGNANGFVGDAVEIVRIRQQALEIFTPPQQQEVKQIGKDAADQGRENKWARRQTGSV